MVKRSKKEMPELIEAKLQKLDKGRPAPTRRRAGTGYPAWLEREIAEKRMKAAQEQADIEQLLKAAAAVVKLETQNVANQLLQRGIEPDTTLAIVKEPGARPRFWARGVHVWVVDYRERSDTRFLTAGGESQIFTTVTFRGISFDKQGELYKHEALKNDHGTGVHWQDPAAILQACEVSMDSAGEFTIEPWQNRLATFAATAISRHMREG